MPRRVAVRSPRRRLLGLLPVLLVLVAAGAFLVQQRSSSAATPQLTPITLKDALASYRKHPGPLRNDIGWPKRLPTKPNDGLKGFKPPAAGVYTYKTNGRDWVELDGKKYTREFPATTYATVRHAGGCVWELWMQAADQYTDAHRQCSTPGEFLCLAHIQHVSFAGITKDMTHKCDPPMIQVGGKAVKAGGKEKTICYASKSDASRIEIHYVAEEPITIGGVHRTAYHVKLYSYVKGEVNGSALADVWFDSQTGMYLKMIRTQDTSGKSSGKSATYRVRITYELASITPQT
ncbi:MAG: hypothetical protein HOY79_48910 [Streptomyces sp.]|nr:hypothetical protein [Streptomyces sp.]